MCFPKFAAKMTQCLSAAVRTTIFGLVTSVTPMGDVKVTLTAHVGASELFPQMDSSVSQYEIKVSTVLVAIFLCQDIMLKFCLLNMI